MELEYFVDLVDPVKSKLYSQYIRSTTKYWDFSLLPPDPHFSYPPSHVQVLKFRDISKVRGGNKLSLSEGPF